MPLKALIFDFDGTILDTETPEFRSWQAIYSDFGCELPLAEWVKAIGLGQDQITFDPYAYLQTCTGKIIDRDALRVRRRKLFAELLAEEPLRPGVREYLVHAREAGLTLAIASSSDRAWIDGHLHRFDLQDFFEAIRCADDVTHTKPHPEHYLTAASALGVSPAEAVAFEDSPNGALAAKRAGMFCVVVPNPMTRHLSFEEPDLTVASLPDLPLTSLLAEISVHPHFN